MKEDSCADVREQLLVADPAELRGAGDSAVARHVRSCAACGRDAGSILEAQARIGGALDALAKAAAAGAALAPQTRREPRSRPVRRLVLGLATAAALALVLLQERDGADREQLPGPLATAIDAPVVNVAGDDPVAVMSTSDPRITVVWYLERER